MSESLLWFRLISPALQWWVIFFSTWIFSKQSVNFIDKEQEEKLHFPPLFFSFSLFPLCFDLYECWCAVILSFGLLPPPPSPFPNLTSQQQTHVKHQTNPYSFFFYKPFLYTRCKTIALHYFAVPPMRAC